MDRNTPQLYYAAASAPCRSVIMVAAALRLKLNLKPINLMEGDHLRPTFLRISPHHTVPTLVDNEFSMFESRAICIYLVEKYGKNDALYPKNPKTRATINQLIYFDMGTLFKRFYDYFMPAFRGEPQDPQKLESLKEALELFDKFLGEKKFAVGYRLTIADLILLASVSTIDTVGLDLSGYKNVSRWYDNMKNTAPGWKENLEGLEIMKGMMAKMMPPKEEISTADEVKQEKPVTAPVVHEVHFKPNIEIIPDPSTPEPVAIQPLIEVTPAQPIQPLNDVQTIPEVEVTPAPAIEIEPSAPIQAIPEIEPAEIQPIQPLAEFQPIQPLAEPAFQGISPLIHVEPAGETVVVTTTQQITPLIEVSSEPVQITSETITTTTKEVSQNQEVITEVITEVKESITTTEQVVTKVIQVESATKTEVLNGGAIELVENGKYEGEEVKI